MALSMHGELREVLPAPIHFLAMARHSVWPTYLDPVPDPG